MDRDIIIRADSLVKSYSTGKQKLTPVLKGLSLEVEKGEYLAIVGPSGVGKSTLLYLLGSIDFPDQGKVELFLNGRTYDYSKLNKNEISGFRNRSIGFIFQFHHLLPEFTALENLMIPAFIAGKSYSEARNRASELIEIVGVSHRSDHKPMELSGGEQQRVAIARALINNPEIVFADEPTGNLDSANSEAVLSLIMELREMYELTFIVATHSQDVAGPAHRIIKLGDGRIIGEERMT